MRGVVLIHVRSADGVQQLATIPCDDALEAQARDWSYVSRNRRRWNEVAPNEMSQRAQTALRELNIDVDKLRSATRRVRGQPPTFQISCDPHADDWAGRVLPWEALLAWATRPWRDKSPILVVRHLDVDREPVQPPSSMLFVSSAPGPVSSLYEFSAERLRVESAAGLKFNELVNPTIAELAEWTQLNEPSMVHLTGIDIREANTELSLGLVDADDVRGRDGGDGYLLPSADLEKPIHAVSPQRLARALRGENRRFVVTTNFYNSAARIGAELVRTAADAAIGFRDEVDNATAEAFYANFYRALANSRSNVLKAFRFAWMKLYRANQSKLVGSGIVLWSAFPLIQETSSNADSDPECSPAAISTEEALDADTELRPEDVVVRVEPRDELNYAALHNGESIFRNFRIEKLRAGRLQNVRVEVELFHGLERYTYRRTLNVTRWIEQLGDEVRPALTSMLSRSIDESVRTAIYIKVTAGQSTLYEDTHRVSMLPPDEWRYSRESCPWLPSFVLPKDPAVGVILDNASKYLIAMDHEDGFDGYTSDRNVLNQVRAIWTALQELRLTYIAPPPRYRQDAQRIRTPSQVLQHRRGTCIDLALLVASCLEAIDLYPVLFLTPGHAFVGYWGAESYHRDFVQVRPASTRDLPLRPLLGQTFAWQVEGNEASHSELDGYVATNELVPLETTLLTRPTTLANAIKRAIELFNDTEELETILDIRLARQSRVTPLPLCRSEGRVGA